MENKIQISSAGKIFSGNEKNKNVIALQDINLSIRANEFITFVGASG